jgi:hypothetical protein
MKHVGLILLLALGLAATAWAEIQYVQVEKTRLLSRASAFSKAKVVLPYRTRVETLGRQGAFIQVRTASGTGYVSARSLSDTKPAYSAKLSREYVSSDEVAMATKGFNAQVEAEYRHSNPNLAYDDLNRLEKQTTYADPAAAFQTFRKTGRLGEYRPGGDAE